MNSRGIYILANDVVYDQLVALLNSIEINVSQDLPICILPYDDRLDLVKQEINSRPHVTLFENQTSLKKWDDFADKIWSAHPRAKSPNYLRPGWYRGHLQRKFAAFDGEFEEFVFYEADMLAMKPINRVFELLQNYDFIFDDWERNKPIAAAALNIPLIEKSTSYQEDNIRLWLHDASFWSSKKGLFTEDILQNLTKKLISEKEVEWINGIGWWDDVFLFNYMTFRLERPIFNFTLSANKQEVTGNCAEIDPFVNIDNVLYNQQGKKPIHRIHYMNYGSSQFRNLCNGIDEDIKYKDIFLHYRFLKNPEQKPSMFRRKNLLDLWSEKSKKIKGKIRRTLWN